jgi:hypothetical protein
VGVAERVKSILRRWILASVCATGSASCGSSASIPREPLCDGQPGIRFSYTAVSTTAFLPAGHGLLWDNGGSLFVVTGDCRYWSAYATFDDYRTGTLEPAEADRLRDMLLMEQWASLDGMLWSNPGVFDASVGIFGDGVHHLALRGLLDPMAPDFPPVVLALYQWLQTDHLALRERAVPVDGPIRYRLFSNSDTALSVQTAVWPLAIDPATVVEGPEAQAVNEAGMGRLVSAAGEANALRALRRHYITERPDGFPTSYRSLPIGDGTTRVPTYWLIVRDTTPLEDTATGLVPGIKPDGT